MYIINNWNVYIYTSKIYIFQLILRLYISIFLLLCLNWTVFWYSIRSSHPVDTFRVQPQNDFTSQVAFYRWISPSLTVKWRFSSRVPARIYALVNFQGFFAHGSPFPYPPFSLSRRNCSESFGRPPRLFNLGPPPSLGESPPTNSRSARRRREIL